MTNNAVLAAAHERELIQGLRSGDPASVRAWFAQYHSRLLQYVHTKVSVESDAEDIVQEVFINSLRQLTLFRADSSLWTWMVSIARHEVADFYRKKYARRALRSLPFSQVFEEIGGSIPEGNTEQQELIQVVLVRLTVLQRELLQQKYIDGKSVLEIAQSVGKTVKSVESELFRARVAFKEFWGQAAVSQL